jgi:hypothetical protein
MGLTATSVSQKNFPELTGPYYLSYVNGGMWWMPAAFIEKLRPKE